MSPKRKAVLYAVTAAWVVLGTLWYCYAFTRDFYAANRNAIHSLLGPMVR